MMKKNNISAWQRRRYLHQIKVCIPGKKALKKKIAGDIAGELDDLLENEPLLTMAQVQQRLGTPQAIAKEYLETLSSDELSSKIIRSAWIARVLAIVIVAVVVALSTTIVCLVQWNLTQMSGASKTASVSDAW